MGVLKIWHMNPDVVDSQGMLQHVQQLLAQDSDAQVLGNCVTLLMQVQGVKRISSNKMLMYTLINRIKVGWGARAGQQQVTAPGVNIHGVTLSVSQLPIQQLHARRPGCMVREQTVV
jgi:hypothetical protein